MLARERFAGGAERVELVRLGAVAAGRARRPFDLDHPLAVLEQERRQSGAEAAGRLDRPDPPAGCVLASEAQQLLVADRVGADRGVDLQRARQRGDDRRRMRIAVGVDADHVIDLVCEHASTSRKRGDRTNGGRPGQPRGETVMGHARTGGQASDEASGAAPGPTPAITNRQLQGKDTATSIAEVGVSLRVRSATASASLSEPRQTTQEEVSQCVLPVPGGPRKQTLAASSIQASCARWVISGRSAPGWAAKSKSSSVLGAGKPAARMRWRAPEASRAKTSASQSASRNCS